MSTDAFRLETSHDILEFNPRTGALISFRSKAAPDQEFIHTRAADPVFVIQYLDGAHRFHQIASSRAMRIETRCETQPEGATILTAIFRGLADFDLDVTVTVRASPQDRLSRWSLALRSKASLMITDVQFPFIVAPYHLAGAPGTEQVLWPYGPGVLLKEPKPQDLQPDCPHTWQMCPENGDTAHYPGYVVAQFLAYFNDRAGIYLACQDTGGRVKLIRPVHREPGLRLGLAHVGDWPACGERQLEYDVVLGSFTGDWHAAAELYRSWGLKQVWAQQPLHRRQDVPDWLADSPPHVILRIQGELDLGPVTPNEEFLPYRKTIPMLEDIAARIKAPLVPVIMSWERPGPWIYPDCFPPAGGDASLREFTQMARDRGWHIGTFCNGTRWVVGHYWSGYDGEEYFAEHGGDHCICRTASGAPWKEKWDETWRPSYPCCLAVPMTRKIAMDFVRRVVDDGLDWIQFLDQNVGCATFPCYARDHGHPPVPGQWMTEQMQLLAGAFREQAQNTLERSAGARKLAFSVEVPVNEVFLPYFHICDIRVVPPGHDYPWAPAFVPLYHYLYHEMILIQGGFGSAPEPYHLQIRNAYNWVVGEIPGAVMKGDGTLLNLDTMNWAPWDVEVGDNDQALQMLRATTTLRRGAARDFLVYGRMLPPAQVEGIATIRWQHGGRDHQIPSVFHAAWQAPDGRFALALANWTDEWQDVSLDEPRLGATPTLYCVAPAPHTVRRTRAGGGWELSLPPLSCTLVESDQA